MSTAFTVSDIGHGMGTVHFDGPEPLSPGRPGHPRVERVSHQILTKARQNAVDVGFSIVSVSSTDRRPTVRTVPSMPSGSPSQLKSPDRYASRKQRRKKACILADRNRRPDAGIDDAVALASEVLYDREDSNGEPLILKSLHSGLSGTTSDEKIRGVLLYVMSDPEWDAGSLREKGFSETVVESLLV